MAEAKKCDRCGEFYQRIDITNRLKGRKIMNVVLASEDGLKLHRFDLCSNCMSYFVEWLGVETDKEEEYDRDQGDI